VTFDFFISNVAPFSWRGFWQLLLWSSEFLYVRPMLFVTLVLAANLILALVHKWPFNRDRWKKEYWFAFVSLLFVPITIAVGDVGAVDPSPMSHAQPSELLVWTNNGMFIGSSVLGIFWIYRMKGLRWFALAIQLIQLWILLGAGFIAGMALSGDWL
jgi:hypothetical protein